MTVHDLNDIMVHWQDPKYRDYEIAVWDWRRQKRMDLVFTGCSHPEKQVNFNVTDKDDTKWFRPADICDIAKEMPSPFQEGAIAVLVEDPDYKLGTVKFTRYFYRCEATEKTFTTGISDTYSMCNYYRELSKALEREFKRAI